MGRTKGNGGNVAKRALGRRLHQSESGGRNQEGFHGHPNHHRGEQEQHEQCAAAMRVPLDTKNLAYQCDRQQAEGWAGRIEPTFDVDRHDSQYLEHVVEDMGTDTDRSCVAPAEAFPGRATKATSRCRGVLEGRPLWSASDRLGSDFLHAVLIHLAGDLKDGLHLLHSQTR